MNVVPLFWLLWDICMVAIDDLFYYHCLDECWCLVLMNDMLATDMCFDVNQMNLVCNVVAFDKLFLNLLLLTYTSMIIGPAACLFWYALWLNALNHWLLIYLELMSHVMYAWSEATLGLLWFERLDTWLFDSSVAYALLVLCLHLLKFFHGLQGFMTWCLMLVMFGNALALLSYGEFLIVMNWIGNHAWYDNMFVNDFVRWCTHENGWTRLETRWLVLEESGERKNSKEKMNHGRVE